MDLRTAYCTNFYEFSIQNTMQRNERLAKMLAKHKKYCSKDNINPYHSQLTLKQKQNLLKPYLQDSHTASAEKYGAIELGQTKFRSNFMEKLKKQRKRQQKRRRDSVLSRELLQERKNKKMNTLQYELPYVKKTLQLLTSKRNKSTSPLNKTISTETNEDKNHEIYIKFKKNKIFSFNDKRDEDQKKEEKSNRQEQSQKVIRILQDIKAKRQKSSKHDRLVEECLENTPIFIKTTEFKRHHLFDLPNIKQKYHKLGKIEKSEPKRSMSLNSKHIEPWDYKKKSNGGIVTEEDEIFSFHQPDNQLNNKD